MIENEPYGAEPWRLSEASLDPDLIAQSESVFALSNGHIGLRGNLDEGDPHGLPGTYLNSLYEDRPLPYAEAGYGFPDMGQTVINVTNGKIIRLLVNDEPFDIRYGIVRSHTRILDMRAGTLTREVVWTSPAGHTVKVKSVRLVSLTQRAIAAISYTVTPVTLAGEPSGEEPADSPGGEPVRVVVLSEIVANEEIPVAAADPRAAAMLAEPLVSEEHKPPTATARGRSWCTPPGRASCGWPARWPTRSPGRRRCRSTWSPSPTWGGSSSPPRCRRARNCGWSSTSATAGRASGPGPRSSTRCRAPWPPPS